MKSAVALPVGLAVLLTVHLPGFWPAVVLLSAVAVLVGVGVLVGVAIDKPMQRDIGYDDGWADCNRALGFACGYRPRAER